MQTRKLEIACPVCSSHEVFYTCTPNCCFNHVCNECGSTFEPVTKATGATLTGVLPPQPLPDATDPRVACIKCDGTSVYMLEDKTLVCASCGCALALELTEIASG